MNEHCPTWFSLWTLWFSLESTDCFCPTDFHYCALSRRGDLMGTQGKCISSFTDYSHHFNCIKTDNLDFKYEPTPQITSFKPVYISFHSVVLTYAVALFLCNFLYLHVKGNSGHV